MKIRTSLLLLLSIILNIIVISVSKFNVFYILSLLTLVISEVFLIYEIVQQIKNSMMLDLSKQKEIRILDVANSLGYDIRFEGNTVIYLNLYYRDEFITSLFRNQKNLSLYYINGLLDVDSDYKNKIALVDIDTLIMRLCEYKTNPEKYLKGDKDYEWTNLME